MAIVFLDHLKLQKTNSSDHQKIDQLVDYYNNNANFTTRDKRIMPVNSPFIKSFDLDKESNKNLMDSKDYNAFYSTKLRRQNTSIANGQ